MTSSNSEHKDTEIQSYFPERNKALYLCVLISRQTYYDCNKDLKDGYRDVGLWQDKPHGIFLIFLIFVEYFDSRNLWE